MRIDQDKIAEDAGYSVNKYGYVACTVEKAFGPYTAGDVAGFVPSDVRPLVEKGYVSLAEAVDPDSTLDPDTVAEAERDRMLAAGILEHHQARAARVRDPGFHAASTIQQNRWPGDTGPDPKVREFDASGGLRDSEGNIPEVRRRPIREVEMDAESGKLQPITATVGAPLRTTAITGVDPKRAAAEAGVHIPDGWEESHADTRKHLASQIAGKDVTSAKEADRIIAEEQEKRSSAQS